MANHSSRRSSGGRDSSAWGAAQDILEITYERDATAVQNLRPVGGFEVFAAPITIANGGARDAVVAALKLDAKNLQTGLTARFRAAYIAEPSYFNVDTAAAARQKTPFSALVIAGRSA
jgi:hypothetical protein